MAGQTWEQEYEAQQSRLRDGTPRCEYRERDSEGNLLFRCSEPGGYPVDGNGLPVGDGRRCQKHRDAR